MSNNNAFDFYAAVNAVRKDIKDGKQYSADDLDYIHAAINNTADLMREMGLIK